jgi:hypothetical protein
VQVETSVGDGEADQDGYSHIDPYRGGLAHRHDYHGLLPLDRGAG